MPLHDGILERTSRDIDYRSVAERNFWARIAAERAARITAERAARVAAERAALTAADAPRERAEETLAPGCSQLSPEQHAQSSDPQRRTLPQRLVEGLS